VLTIETIKNGSLPVIFELIATWDQNPMV